MIRSAPLFRSAFRSAAVALVFGVGLAACGSTPMGSTGPAFSAKLSGTSEVPPTASAGAGVFDATLDKSTKVLSWTLSYSGLTGPATAAHLHGPAAIGSNAGVVVPFGSASSGSTGTATLTDAQVADLMAGKWYTNVHTAANPNGEIRGQVLAK